MKYYALRHKDTKLYYLCGDSILNTLTEELNSYSLYNTTYMFDDIREIRIEELEERYVPYFKKYKHISEWDDEYYTYFIPRSEFEIVEFELTEILK